MNDQTAKEFFEQVNGKKIAWATCPLDYYFIPSRYEKLGRYSYALHGVDMFGKEDTWFMCSGFGNNGWRFFK